MKQRNLPCHTYQHHKKICRQGVDGNAFQRKIFGGGGGLHKEFFRIMKFVEKWPRILYSGWGLFLEAHLVCGSLEFYSNKKILKYVFMIKLILNYFVEKN